MGTFIKGTGDYLERCCGCRVGPCDNAALPTFVKRTASVSKTKCGHAEFGTSSSPPKIYLTVTFSGQTECKSYHAENCPPAACDYAGRYVFSGTSTYTRPACGAPTSGNVALYDDATTICVSDNFLQNQTLVYGDMLSFACGVTGVFSWFNDSKTQRHLVVSSACISASPSSDGFSTTGQEVLSSEYTTATLSGDVDAAMPSFSGSFTTGASTAFFDQTADELTITKRKMEYKFTLPTMTGYSCYKLYWVERFTPAGGGAPTDTSRTYLWNGTDSETGVYTINAPSTPGETEILDVEAYCECS